MGDRGGGEKGKVKGKWGELKLTSGILTSTRVGRASNIFFTLRMIWREEKVEHILNTGGREREERGMEKR